jgi:GTP-binding protein
VAYGLSGVQERGQPFIAPGTPVYEGMVIGLNRRTGDIDVNPTKQQQKTNMRASTEDATVKLVPPRLMSLEECLDFIEDDELVEVTRRTSGCASAFWSPASESSCASERRRSEWPTTA